MMKSRDLDSYLQLGLEILLRQAECCDAFQKKEPMPYEPLSAGQLMTLQNGLTWARQMKDLEVKIISSMHKWPQNALIEWQMRAEEKLERELSKSS